MEEKKWEVWKERIPKKFRWSVQGAKKESKRWRAKEGI